MSRFEIEIPESLSEVKLRNWQAIAVLMTQEKAPHPLEIISALIGQPTSVVELIPVSKIQQVSEAVEKAMKDIDQPLVNLYQVDKIKRLGFEPELDKISVGMLADVLEAFEAPERWHEAMAALYRPVIRETPKFGHLYAIKPYNVDDAGYRERLELMKDAPASLFMGVRGFFLRGMKSCELYTVVSSTRPWIRQEPKEVRRRVRERYE